MRAFLLLFCASLAQATSVTVPINVTVTDQNCTAWTVAGTSITCTSSGPTPPPPTDWPPACATKHLDVSWDMEPHRYLPEDYGGFEPNDVLVVRFKTGTVAIPSPSARFAAAEYGSSPSARLWTLSSTPCDFSSTGKARLAYNLTGTTSITAWFAVNVNEGVVDQYYPQLAMNKYYYLNIKNKDGAACFSTGGCNIFVDFSRP